MSADDGVYYSQNQRKQRRKGKAAAVVAALVVLLGGGAYAATTWMTGRDATVTGNAAAVDPPSAGPSARPSAGPSTGPSTGPSAGPRPGPVPATRSGVRRSSRPSPTPTADDEAVAAMLVGRLMEPPASSSPGGLAVAGDALSVRSEVGREGTAIRVVSARADLTARRRVLGAADSGEQAGAARCTRNFRLAGEPESRIRPGVLLCWRTSAAKSVVTVATNARGRPSAASSVAVIDREWTDLG